ncbi:hypothetical protein RBWH47_05972 [Rhodopirellula baltica WH47]|uniref:Uncharacterized protein n=1 Tax=Rhodopirellula baltica WH47 TaxID=991778 RepID=F2B2A4_RHOBT|nr:hypothetical protein RBWH47_05972 [Rhodopirellula baltica WH47]
MEKLSAAHPVGSIAHKSNGTFASQAHKNGWIGMVHLPTQHVPGCTREQLPTRQLMACEKNCACLSN